MNVNMWITDLLGTLVGKGGRERERGGRRREGERKKERESFLGCLSGRGGREGEGRREREEASLIEGHVCLPVFQNIFGDRL